MAIVHDYHAPATEGDSRVATLVWTRDELLILGEAVREDGDLGALYEWWAENAGPIE